MALSLSSCRRRWACRASRRGGKGLAGCRHFHVHYHAPRQVWAFSPLRLPARFSLLPYLLILPVFFFAVFAFLVCFGWFTLAYFVSSLWSKDNYHELCASDAGESHGEDETEERDVKRVTEFAGNSGLPEVCVGNQEIEEVFEDGLSEESRHISRMASTATCIHNDEEKIVQEVMMFESNKEDLEAIAELDGSSEKHQLVMDIPIDCFLEEPNTREFSSAFNTVKLLDVPYGEGFVSTRKEMPVLCSLEILKFIDKHDTAEVVVNGAGGDFEIPDVPSSDDSTHHDEHRKEIKQEQKTEDLSVNSVVNRLVETIVEEWQQTQNFVIEHSNKLAEDDSMDEDGKPQTVCISDEPHDSLRGTSRLPLDYLCENESETVAASNTPFHEATSDQDGGLEEDLIKDGRAESSTSASATCDFSDKHWQIIEQLGSFANEEKSCEEDSPETSALNRVEDEDIDDNCASMGDSRRLPLIRRSPSQWWHLCGVLDAFAGGED